MRVNSSISYEIQVVGHISERWDDRFFGEMHIKREQRGMTTLQVSVPDSAALRGLMNHLWDLNLEVLSLQPIPTDFAPMGKENFDEN